MQQIAGQLPAEVSMTSLQHMSAEEIESKAASKQKSKSKKSIIVFIVCSMVRPVPVKLYGCIKDVIYEQWQNGQGSMENRFRFFKANKKDNRVT